MKSPTATVAIISGSMNTDSFTRKLLKEVEQRVQGLQMETEFIDVKELALPVYAPDEAPPEVIRTVSEKLREADGIVVGAPEYHGSYTGALKNLLDYLGSGEFEHKPIGLVTTTGGVKSGTNTLNHLRLVFRNLHGLVIPQQFAISQKETDIHISLDDSTSLRLETFIKGLEVEVRKMLLLKDNS
ncbi:FMN-dependent NADH-azoreductase [Alteribacter lacisalsi]|uniref:FMN-dependent NADH-azoreductase n=1 Tax=Alteribacter lacisalsi TaxID=2045244 RepID=A0A2W0H4H1_9BACI|nr:NAD(P)H-dependent oxidoreductase [Alteribacter lacisalsi]PYZ95506.1 FMN-dependent NADH-azoreductase [Alteribacter lacisalsi]